MPNSYNLVPASQHPQRQESVYHHPLPNQAAINELRAVPWKNRGIHRPHEVLQPLKTTGEVPSQEVFGWLEIENTTPTRAWLPTLVV